MKPLRAGLCAAALAMLAGCGTEPSPILGVQGNWFLEFDARASQACPNQIPAGCAGAGTVRFEASGDSLVTTGAGRGACDTCSVALDFTLAAMTATSDDGELAMRISTCRLTGPARDEADMTAQGETVCQLPGTPAVEARGTWRMTRATR